MMEINTNPSLVAPLLNHAGSKAQPAASGSTTSPGAPSSTSPASVPAPQPQDLAQALKHLQEQVAKNSSITLRAMSMTRGASLEVDSKISSS